MVAKNDITGDSIQSRTNSQSYQNNYDAIFRKKVVEQDDKQTRNNEETQQALGVKTNVNEK